MAVPVINTTTSIQAFELGEFMAFQPGASNSPVRWFLNVDEEDLPVGVEWNDYLPVGLEFDPETGSISGVAEMPAAPYVLYLYAVNGAEEVSAPLALPIAVYDTGFHTDDAVEIEFDFLTGSMSREGMAEADALLYAAVDDTLVLALGIKKGETLRDLAVTSVGLALREISDEGNLVLSDGSFIKVGAADTTRYKFIAHFSRATLGPVATSYFTKEEQFFVATAEIQIAYVYVPPGEDAEPMTVKRTSRKFKVRVSEDFLK